MAVDKYRSLVHRILLKYPAARNSDTVLWDRVVKEICPEVAKMPFEQAIYVHELPSPYSISRRRREWQAKDPDCMSDEQVARYRAKLELEYREEYGRG